MKNLIVFLMKLLPAHTRSKTRHSFLRVRERILQSRALKLLTFYRVASVREQHERIAGFVSYTRIDPEAVITIDEPRHREFLAHNPAYSTGRYTFKETFICRVDCAKLHLATGYVATVDNTLLLESDSYSMRLKQSALLIGPIPRHMESIAGTCTTIMIFHRHNYFHWWTECLPRLYLLSRLPADEPLQLLLPDTLKPFQITSLTCCLPPQVTPVYVGGGAWRQVENLVMPSYVTGTMLGYLQPACLDYLRGAVFRHVGLPEAHQPTRRLYISRAVTDHRRVFNEDEVIACLSDYGFETIMPETLPFEEQVRAFHSAEIVVGPRGAGLTNILFSGAIKLLEFTAATNPGPYYLFLSQGLGQTYHYQFCPQRGVTQDYVVDLAELRKTLAAMGIV